MSTHWWCLRWWLRLPLLYLPCYRAELVRCELFVEVKDILSKLDFASALVLEWYTTADVSLVGASTGSGGHQVALHTDESEQRCPGE